MNHKTLQKMLLLMLLINTMWLAGCSSTKKPPMSGDMNMTQIYQETTQNEALTSMNENEEDAELNAVRLRLGNGNLPYTNNVGYTRTAQNEVINLFTQLPNPQIAVYIPPHLTDIGNDEIPVPGYTTSFFLYDKNIIAMPSERMS